MLMLGTSSFVAAATFVGAVVALLLIAFM